MPLGRRMVHPLMPTLCYLVGLHASLQNHVFSVRMPKVIANKRIKREHGGKEDETPVQAQERYVKRKLSKA